MDFVSIRDRKPEGKQYQDIMCIVFDYSIAQTYRYMLGTANEDLFHVDSSFYFADRDYVNDWMQKRIIAWKPLEKASRDEIMEFISKVKIKFTKRS